MKIKNKDLKIYINIIEVFQLMSFFGIVCTLIFGYKSIQMNFTNFIINSAIIQSAFLFIPVITCSILYFTKKYSIKKYDEIRKNIPEYIYKTDFYSTEPLPDKSDKIKISDITEKCYINGYGNYDPNNS